MSQVSQASVADFFVQASPLASGKSLQLKNLKNVLKVVDPGLNNHEASQHSDAKKVKQEDKEAKEPKDKTKLQPLPVYPNKTKYLAAIDEEFDRQVEAIQDKLKGECSEENISLLVNLLSQLKPMLSHVFKKFTKTVYDVGTLDPLAANNSMTLQASEKDSLKHFLERKRKLQVDSSDFALSKAYEEKQDRLGLILKSIQAKREQIMNLSSKNATLLYSLMIRKLQNDVQESKHCAKDSKEAFPGDSQSQDALIQIRFQNQIKDLASIHNIRAKLMIAGLNTLCNSLVLQASSLVKNYSVLKAAFNSQLEMILGEFDSREDYEKILFE